MSKRDCGRMLVSHDALQIRLRSIGPNMFVVVTRACVNDQQLIFVLADAHRKGELLNPSQPPLSDFAASPRDLRAFARLELFGFVVQITIRIAADARRTDFVEPLEHLFRLRTIDAKITGGDDGVGAALRFEIGETGVEA